MNANLEVPRGIQGFGNYLVWMVATRATALVDSVYAAGSWPGVEWRMIDEHHLPTQSVIAWLILAGQRGVHPAQLPRDDQELAAEQRKLRGKMTLAMGGAPKRFREEWLRYIAALCELTQPELDFLAAARFELGYQLDPEALRKAVRATRQRGLPEGRHGRTGVASPAGPHAASTESDPGTARNPEPQLVIGQIPHAPLGYIARNLVDTLADAVAVAPVAVVCVVTGLRGVGKTQLAAAYARQLIGDGWPLVAWINAETPGDLLRGLAEVAGRLGVADPGGDPAASARRLCDYLPTRDTDGLLVFDNARHPEDLVPFLPAVGTTQIVVTSTSRDFMHFGETVDVPAFTRAESVSFLTERTGRPEVARADEVAEELGDLPLALSQAAATINIQRLTYAAYLESLRRLPVHRVLRNVPGGYPDGVEAALLYSVHSAEALDPGGLTGRMLRVMAGPQAGWRPTHAAHGPVGGCHRRRRRGGVPTVRYQLPADLVGQRRGADHVPPACPRPARARSG
jgi:hypothetical protein